MKTRAELWATLIAQMQDAMAADLVANSGNDEANLPVQLEVLGAAGKVIVSHATTTISELVDGIMSQMEGAVDEALAQFVADFPIAPITANE